MTEEAATATSQISAVLHPTDLTSSSELAFAHALRLAASGRTKLYLLHADPPPRIPTGAPIQRFGARSRVGVCLTKAVCRAWCSISWASRSPRFGSCRETDRLRFISRTPARGIV